MESQDLIYPRSLQVGLAGPASQAGLQIARSLMIGRADPDYTGTRPDSGAFHVEQAQKCESGAEAPPPPLILRRRLLRDESYSTPRIFALGDRRDALDRRGEVVYQLTIDAVHVLEDDSLVLGYDPISG